MSTPYEQMSRILEAYNYGVPRAAQWTITGKDKARRILALDKNSDPFYAGQDWQREAGEWFASFHRTRVGNRRLHIRYLYYVATGEDPSPLTGQVEATYLPSGERFEKTSANWKFIQDASKYARNMELVDARLIIDKKRSVVTENATPVSPYFTAPSVTCAEPSITFPSSASQEASVMHATAEVPDEREFVRRRHPSIVEIWVEKDLDEADEPVLENVATSKGVNLVVGSGFMTISAAYSLLERTRRSGLPARVIYLADHDSAGRHMPVSPARHIEFAIRDMDPRPDIRLYHLALTPEQIAEQQIPRKIPKTKREDELLGRDRNFQQVHGEGTVELNTLTDPGRARWFERLLSKAIDELRDPDLRGKRRQAHEEATNLVEAEFTKQMRWPHKALDLIAEQAKQRTEKFSAERRAIAEKRREYAALLSDYEGELRREMAPLRVRSEAVLQVARARLERLEDLELPIVDAEEREDAAEGWLFDSRRDYFDQLPYYMFHKYGIPLPDPEDDEGVLRGER